MNKNQPPILLLNKEEKSLLIKNGFYVKALTVKLKEYYLNILYRVNIWWVFFPLIGFTFMGVKSGNFIELTRLTYQSGDNFIKMVLLCMIVSFLYGIYKFFYSIYIYFIIKYAYFYRKSGKEILLIGNSINPKEFSKKLNIFTGSDIASFRKSSENGDQSKAYLGFLWSSIFPILCLYYLWIHQPIVNFLILFTFIGILFYGKNHPLYAFGNLGEKIQKLTPTIESKSKEIQENFKKDMNFRVLSEGFDSLSSTFSEIVRLVIKLEQVEKKANKGNLFDSEKYINSLRGDILTPLNSLKSFLEEQREKLLESQKELKKIQVRVGGNTEITSESELSSKRGESLMNELDGNISKLEEMIGKMK